MDLAAVNDSSRIQDRFCGLNNTADLRELFMQRLGLGRSKQMVRNPCRSDATGPVDAMPRGLRAIAGHKNRKDREMKSRHSEKGLLRGIDWTNSIPPNESPRLIASKALLTSKASSRNTGSSCSRLILAKMARSSTRSKGCAAVSLPRYSTTEPDRISNAARGDEKNSDFQLAHDSAPFEATCFFEKPSRSPYQRLSLSDPTSLDSRL